MGLCGYATLKSERKACGIKVNASYKVAVLGAGRTTGAIVSLVLTLSPLVSTLNIYDETFDMEGAADALRKDECQVVGYKGASELENSLKDVDVVVITPSVPKSNDDVFHFDATMVKGMVQSVAAHSPEAFILIVSKVLNSVVPLAAEVLKDNGVYDPKKLFGITKLDVSTAKSIVGQELETNLVDVPVVGGLKGLPLLSKTKPSLNYTEEKMEKLAIKIQNVLALSMSGAGLFTPLLLTAQAVETFLHSLLRALDGDDNVYEYAFVASTITELPFFASKIKLGKSGIEAVMESDLHRLSKFEEKALEDLKLKLKANIEKGIAFAAEGN